jgi:hypothetical protein
MADDSRLQDRTSLRLPADTFAAIDAACASRPGVVSRNTWISEAVAEKLARETANARLSAARRDA